MNYIRDDMVFKIFDCYAIFVGLQPIYKKAKLDIPAFVKGVPVTEIQNDACSSNSQIQRLMLPHTIKKIGDGAFWSCKNLEIVQLLTTSEQNDLIIGKYAFANCTKLVSFHAKTEIEIQEEAFAYSYKLGLLEGCVRKIEPRVFNDTALDVLILANNAEVLNDGFYRSKIKELICVRNATFHNSAIRFIQTKNINIHCPQTSNVVDLAYLGISICAN